MTDLFFQASTDAKLGLAYALVKFCNLCDTDLINKIMKLFDWKGSASDMMLNILLF